MSEEINQTSSSSPRDYAMTLLSLNAQQLAEVSKTNYWCWKNLQQTNIDYKARYLACLALQLQRGHLDYIESTT